MRKHLTTAAVERLKPPAKGQLEIFDDGYPGLALRVSCAGTRAWVLHARVGGKLKRIGLGRFPAVSLGDAREAWRVTRERIAAGKEPVDKPINGTAETFEEVAATWLKRDQAGNRTHDEVKRMLDVDVLPKWGHRRIDSITRREAVDLIDGVVDRGAPIVARRLQAHLHRLFRWSVGKSILSDNPLRDAEKPGQETRRKRRLTDGEIRLVWNAAAELGFPFGPIYQLLMLTGARLREISELRWNEIQDDEIQLEGGRTKTGEPHTIPLSKPARAILKPLPRIVGCPYVFSTNGRAAVSGYAKAKRRLDDKITEANENKPLPAFRIHDLRRTMASGMQRLRVPVQVTEACLGHVSGSRGGIVGVYQVHAYDKEKCQALSKWARHVEAIVAQRQRRAAA